jgi:hypothetical protein
MPLSASSTRQRCKKDEMTEKILTIILFIFGLIFLIFNKQSAAAIRWVDKAVWNEKRRRLFPGHGGIKVPRWGVVLLGTSWIISALVIWFTSKP